MRKVLIFVSAALLPAYDFTPPRIPSTRSSPRWEKLLRTEVRYLRNTTPAGEIPNELEHSIRPLTATALSAAVCLKFAGCDEAAATLDFARRILSQVTRTHLTGGGRTASGRAWGRQWQSALWAWQAAFAAWLLWPDLPADLRQAVVAMTIDEADRFIDLPPPYSEFFDTKAEENAWNSLILVLASEALGDHPHRARWRERALEYMISAFATRADRSSEKQIDGRRLKDWVSGANLHDDFTLENHGFVHPDYMSTVSLNLANAVVYRLLGRPVPEATFYHAREVYENLKWFSLPDGSLLYPSGTDWNLHRVDMTGGLHVAMERLLGDPHAGALAEAALSTLEKMQARNPDGRTFAPGEFPSYPTHEPNTAWLYAFAVLDSKLWELPARAAGIAQVWRTFEGERFFDDARCLLVRSRDAISSFSWGLRVMGQTVPFTADPIVNPLNHSYVGLAAELPAGRERPGRTGIGSAALERALAQDTLAIGTVIPGSESGALHATVRATHSGRPHVFSFTALPDGKSVYMERWGGKGPAQGALISLLEEPAWVHGAAKRRIEQDGRTWLSVDGRLGYAISNGGGIRVVEDVQNTLVVLNEAPADDAVIVTLPNATTDETRRFAASSYRLKTDQPDVAAAIVDGFAVATNFSPHPLTAIADHKGKRLAFPINGYATRVIRIQQ